jgi:hypothetical protein
VSSVHQTDRHELRCVRLPQFGAECEHVLGGRAWFYPREGPTKVDYMPVISDDGKGTLMGLVTLLQLTAAGM